MAQFGSEVTQAEQIPVHNTPEEGVVKQPALLQGLADTFQRASASMKAQKKSAAEAAVGGFVDTQLKIADAYAQGKIKSSAHARTQMRHELMKAISANPSLAGDYLKAMSALNVVGGADIVEQQTRSERITEAREDWLITNGYLGPNFTESQFQQADQTARQAATAERRYDKIKRDTELTKIEREEEARRYIKDTSGAAVLEVKKQFETVINSNLSPAEKIARIEQTYAGFEINATEKVSDLSSDDVNLYMKPFQRMRDLYTQIASGELDKTVVDTQLTNMLNEQKMILMANPDFARVAAAQDYVDFGAFDVNIQGKALNAVLEAIAGNSPDSNIEQPTPFKTGSEGEEVLGNYLRQINKGIVSTNPETQKAAVENVNNMLGSVEDFSGQIRKDPKRAKQFVDMLASPTFLKVITSDPEAFTNREVATEVLTEHFANEVWGMVQREFVANNVGKVTVEGEGSFYGRNRTRTRIAKEGAESRDVVPGAEIGYRTTSSGMEFFPADPTDEQTRQRAAYLNKNLRPVINKTLQAFSHLEGHSNYGKSWDKVQELIMTTTADNISGDAGDDLILKDVIGTAPIEGQSDHVNETHATLTEILNLTPEQVAGVMGNLIVESGSANLDPTAVGDNGNALGIAQWNGPRKTALEEFSASKGMEATDIRAQLMFLVEELNGSERGALRKLRQATTAEEAAEIFSDSFERPGTPHLSRRKKEAMKFLEILKGSG